MAEPVRIFVGRTKAWPGEVERLKMLPSEDTSTRVIHG